VAPLAPGKMGKVRVSGAGNNSTVLGLELSSSVIECNDLGRPDDGEIQRVEKEKPL